MDVKYLENKIAELIHEFEKENKGLYVDDIELQRFVLLTGSGGLTLHVKVKIGNLKELYKNM